MRSLLFVGVLACSCAPTTVATRAPDAPTQAKPPAAPPTKPPKAEAAPPRGPVVDSVRVRAALSGDDEGLVLAEMVFGERTAWLLFSPSGDDLYAQYVEFGATISDDLCRANAAFLTRYVEEPFERLKPHVSLDASACATPERKVLTVAPGVPPAVKWLRIENHPEESPPGWYALWDAYGFGTELWVWGLMDAKPDTPADARFGDYAFDALYWGAPPLLEPAP